MHPKNRLRIFRQLQVAENRLSVALPPVAAQGFVKVSVVDRKTGAVVHDYPIQKNLILDQGMDLVDTTSWINCMTHCVAGTGTTPTKDLLDGTWSQTGTTLTSSGSTYTLSGGDVGKWISWASGAQAKITAVTDGTTATVAQTQSVAAGAANLFRANQIGLATEIKRTNTYPLFTASDGNNSVAIILDPSAQKVTLRRTYDFSAEVSSRNYTEIGIAPTGTSGNNLFSRILLAGAVTVTTDQQLRVQYDLVLQMANIASHPTSTLAITNWPVTYNITSITSNGSAWTITTSTTHHFVTGGKVNIANALPVKTAVIAATSTVSDFTLTTGSAHGLSPGDSFVVEDVTPSGYNGTWTAASGTTGSTIVVTSTANPGTGTVFGTIRKPVPGTWYDGEVTIASTPSGTTFTVTSAASIIAAGASGTVYNNTKAAIYPAFWGIEQPLTSGAGFVAPDTYLYPKFVSGNNRPYLDMSSSIAAFGFSNGLKTPPSFASGGSTLTGSVAPTSTTKVSYVNGNFYQDHNTVFDPGVLNYTNIRSFAILAANSTSNAITLSANSSNQCLIQLEEPQLKDSSRRLTLTLRRSWTRVFA